MSDVRIASLEKRIDTIERKNGKLGIAVRQALLMLLDVLERHYDVSPTTANIRKMWREHYRNPERQEP